MLLCASPDYLRRSGEPITMDALSRHQAVGYLHAGCDVYAPAQLRGNGELQPVQATGKMMDDMQGSSMPFPPVPVLLAAGCF